MTSPFTAVFDACVLYPAPLRDLLVELAITDQFRAKWSAMIHEEWITAALRERKDLKRSSLERTRALMDQHVEDSIVMDFEDLIPSLRLPDPKDRHVLAAAICGRADVIVTYNLKDFPAAVLSRFRIEAQHPDQFIGHLADLAPQVVCHAARTVRHRLKNPPKTVADYIACLRQQGLPQTAAFLEENEELL